MVEYHFGLTATRLGMTAPQRSAVRLTLHHVKEAVPNQVYWLHHGDCVGGDEQGHEIAKGAGFKVHVHPPIVSKFRAYCEGDLSSEPKSYPVRNKDIVRASICMIVAPLWPDFRKRVRGSGTTMTYNMAKELDKDIVVCYPDGSMEHEGEVFGL